MQAILTVLAFVVIDFEDLIFWGVVTFVLSLLPLIGASIVWIPAVVYLAIVGNIPAAVGLQVYGTVVISSSDNFVRPLAMQRGARLNSGLLVLGIFGGVAVFGFPGLFTGPVILGLSKVIVNLLVEQSYWGCRKSSSICWWKYVVHLEKADERPACANRWPSVIPCLW